MRISNIEITNFQGLRHAALAVSEPLLLVSGHNGAGKSSLLDAISMALTGQPRRVSLKKDMGQLVTEGAKKGEAVVSWIGANGEEESAAVALPSGKGAPLVDMPCLPFVLDASKFAALDSKERRRILFALTGATASPNEIAKRLEARGAYPNLVEQIKPMLRAGFDAAAAQAKEYASEARGAWKAVTGETYGSEKAEGWEPAISTQIHIKQEDLDAAAKQVAAIEADLGEAQQTLGGHKSAMAAAGKRQQRIAELGEVAELLQRRENKLNHDRANLKHWQQQLYDAEAAAAGTGKQGLIHDMARNMAEWQALAERTDGVKEKNGPSTPWFVLGEMDRMNALMDRYVAEHGPLGSESEGSDELAKRAPEFRTVVESLTRAVINSERDVKSSQDAAAQVEALKAEASNALPPEAIANAEQVINELRQERDKLLAKQQALHEAHQALNGRDALIVEATKQHTLVKGWVTVADALSPTGIPAEILADALSPVNTLLAELSAQAGWQEVAISSDIDVTFDGRLYGLLSESEKWRCDALLAIAIASLSGLRFMCLDRYDVLDLPSRGQIIKLLMARTQDGTLDSAIIAGTMKAAMERTPAGLQAVWIEDGVIGDAFANAA
ncbi:AAA family ATPase [Pseudomonas sp. B392_1p]|uniref:AAA family ATPase n=1 Tax=Pseudomonas sp. B392_1p TaxID=3457507 RepID=UPI003FD6207F